MYLSAVCPKCSVKYQIKADLAGKKFNCKKCGAAVQIPAQANEPEDDVHQINSAEQDANHADDFFSLPTVSETSGNTYGLKSGSQGPAALPVESNTAEFTDTAETEPFDLPESLPIRAKKKKRKKKKEASHRDEVESQFISDLKQGYFAGLPISVLLSVLCGIVLMTYCFFMIFIRGFQGIPGASFFYTLRFFWLTWITLGIYSGKALPRYIAILLTIFGLFWGYHEWAYMLPLDEKVTTLTQDYLNLLLNYGAVTLQCVCWIVNLVALLMPQTAEHCQEM